MKFFQKLILYTGIVLFPCTSYSQIINNSSVARICSENSPCSERQGDCDTDRDCESGLVCLHNHGDDYGLHPTIDVCVQPWLGSPKFCSEDSPCEVNEGHCENSGECKNGLFCKKNLGAQFGFHQSIDVCAPLEVGNPEFCSETSPCAIDEGHCENDNECESGLKCRQNVGAEYGFHPSVDVCRLPWNGSLDFCSESSPCQIGQGDCNSDSECVDRLVCGKNNGREYGFHPSIDVCELPLVSPLQTGIKSRGVMTSSGYSVGPLYSISEDSRYVALLTNLVNIHDPESEIKSIDEIAGSFVHTFGVASIHLKTHDKKSLTFSPSNSLPGYNFSRPQFSKDNKHVLFWSFDSFWGYDQIYVGNTETGETVTVTSNSLGEPGVPGCYTSQFDNLHSEAAISNDGRYVIFSSKASFDPFAACAFLEEKTYLKDLLSGELIPLSLDEKDRMLSDFHPPAAPITEHGSLKIVVDTRVLQAYSASSKDTIDKGVYVLDTSTGDKYSLTAYLQEVPGAELRVHDIQFTPDGKYIIFLWTAIRPDPYDSFLFGSEYDSDYMIVSVPKLIAQGVKIVE